MIESSAKKVRENFMKTFNQHANEIRRKQKIKFIGDNLSNVAKYIQLSEEASEVAQAAAKIARILDGTSPTPKTIDEAYADLSEEMNDLYIAYETCFGHSFSPDVNCYKIDRTVDRICKARDIAFE